ncbi:MAG TPA: hypothetical protein VHO02_08550 [Fibrobacteria bacterium]|jgi:hypothetical protein|nr:hypothetical protein [Fibrobacteria bacterium]
MHEYEIRILNSDGSVALICEEIQLHDNAAIRSASRMALGRPFEVWRGIECIRSARDVGTAVDKPPEHRAPS